LLSPHKIDEKELVTLLVKLIRAKSENPPGFEEEVASVVKEYLEFHGLSCTIYEKSRGRANVLCHIGSGRPSLAFICHMDVVPAGASWTRPPYEGVVEGDRVYGRGATDNKGALATVLAAAASVSNVVEKSSGGTVTIVAVADEEQGNAYGISYLINEVGFRPDYAIVCEPTSCKSVVIAEKGILRLKLRSRGKPAHGSRPEEGVNAIVKLSKVLARLEGFRMSYEEHPLFTAPTINIGVIHGGEAVNVVPSECTCTLDIRYLPSQTPEKILAEMRAFIEEVRKEDPQVNVEAEITEFEEPLLMPQGNALIKLLEECSMKAAGFKPVIRGMSGGTVAKPLFKKGVLSVVYGPGDEQVCHKTDEYIEISQLKLASQIYAEVMLSFGKYLGGLYE
jgi:acetylornithine deacetylase/succinyl-diaminopimelate desuccinylase family protein